MRYGGARGQLTVRADSGLLRPHCRCRLPGKWDVRFSITIRQRASLRDLIEAIPEEDWTPIPYWMDGRRRCRRDHLHPLTGRGGRRAGAAHRPAGEAGARFPTRPLRQIQLSRLHHRPGWGDAGNWRPIIAATPRSRTPYATSSYGVGLNHMPSARFAANGAWLAVQVMAHKPGPLDGADWSGRADRDHQDPQAAGLRSGGTDHPLGAPPHFASPPALGLGKPSSVAPWPGCKPFPFPA